MITNLRNDSIIKDYKTKKYSLVELSKKYKISSERIRQIANKIEIKFCKRHKRQFQDKCDLCFIMNHYPKLLKTNHINEEIRLLTKQDRRLPVVYMRTLLVQKLRKEKMPYYKIAKLLQRDHTSIIHLSKKKLI